MIPLQNKVPPIPKNLMGGSSGETIRIVPNSLTIMESAATINCKYYLPCGYCDKKDTLCTQIGAVNATQ